MATIDVLLAGMSVGTDQARLGLGAVALVRGQSNIVVDVGHYGRREILEQALKSHGLKPDDIQTVVLTHSHWDHVQNVDLFPKSRFLIHPLELEYSCSPHPADWATPKYFAATLEGLDVQEVVEGTELEPGVRIIETPGHSRGTIGVVVDTPEGTAVVASDALPDAEAARYGRPYLVFWNVREAEQSIRKIKSHGSIIYPGHDRPFRLGADGSTQYMEGASSIMVMAGFVPAGEVGVGVTISLEPGRQPWVRPGAEG